MLSASYALATGARQPGEQSLDLYYELNLAYYPTRALYMEAYVGLAAATSWPSHVQTTTPSFMLSLTYGRLFEMFALKLEGYYDSTKSSDGLVNIRDIDVTAGVTWHLEKFFRRNVTLSFQVSCGVACRTVRNAFPEDAPWLCISSVTVGG
jgi:hypothetical protein